MLRQKIEKALYLSFEVAKELFARLVAAIELSDEFEVLIGDKSSFHNYIQFLKPGEFFKKHWPQKYQRVKN